MKVLTDERNIVVYISETAEIIDGAIYVDNGTLSFGTELTINDVATIPVGVVQQKYCYNTEKGFYLNLSFKGENEDQLFPEIQQLRNDVDMLLVEQLKSEGIL